MTRPDAPLDAVPHDARALPPNPYNPHAWVIGEPTVGAGTWIGAFTVIDGSGGLTIGAGCDISSGVHLYTHSSVRRCLSGRTFPAVERAPVHIGDHVFIGAGAIVNMGVRIGDNSVVGAGAVVSRDVAPYTVVGGVPAQPIATVHIDGDTVTFRPLGRNQDAPNPTQT